MKGVDFVTGAQGRPAVLPPIYPDHVTSTEARRLRTRWHHAFNSPDGQEALLAVRCKTCRNERLLGEVRDIDGVMVLGLRSPTKVFDRFEILRAETGPGGAFRHAADPSNTPVCPFHPAADPLAQRHKIGVALMARRSRTTKI